jgi:AcrR family transcriptional regulator
VPNGPTTRPSTPEHLVVTAERLIAEEGVEGVSLRRIATEAGLRNPASVQYHFGTREALLRAVVELRVPPINEHRLRLLAALDASGRPNDVGGLVGAMVRPLAELDRTSRYVEFLVRVGTSEAFAAAYLASGRLGRSIRTVNKRLEAVLGDLSPAVRAHRIQLASSSMVSAVAAHRAGRGRQPRLDDEAFCADLVVALVGLLTAPPANPRST